MLACTSYFEGEVTYMVSFREPSHSQSNEVIKWSVIVGFIEEVCEVEPEDGNVVRSINDRIHFSKCNLEVVH